MTTYFTKLENRRILLVGGEQAAEFLQGLVSNDVTRAHGSQAVFATLLTPQGKFLHEFFIVEGPGGLLLETDGGRIEDLKKRLSLYRLRSKVTLEVAGEDLSVWAVWGPGATEIVSQPHGTAVMDPRLAALGVRIITKDDPGEALAAAGLEPASAVDYDLWRLRHAVPEGSADLKPESSALLESNYDALNAIAWDKGCYMGQELTARTRYRGLVKRRLVGIGYEGAALEPGSALSANGRQVGEVRSTREGIGMASLRLDALDEGGRAELTAGDGRAVTAHLPDYVSLS